MDWCSLLQAEQMELELEVFKKSLTTTNVWYAHTISTVWMLTSNPDVWPSRPCKERGWPTFEQAISCMIAESTKILDLAHFRNDVDYYDTVKICRVRRPAPSTPEDFLNLLQMNIFTDDADVELVAEKYRQTFDAAMTNGQQLRFSNLGWSV